jgi:hypothetical protein
MDLERAIQFLLEQQSAQYAWAHAQQVRFDAQQAQFRADFGIGAELRRGVRLAVEEARRERKRRKEEDANLAALHAATEKSLQRFIDSLQPPNNGHDKV